MPAAKAKTMQQMRRSRGDQMEIPFPATQSTGSPPRAAGQRLGSHSSDWRIRVRSGSYARLDHRKRSDIQPPRFDLNCYHNDGKGHNVMGEKVERARVSILERA
jgi:hypothetical protein